jgi:repressor LexA
MLQLEKKGYLKRNPYNPKDYQVIYDKPEKTITYLNLYGLASCGINGSILDGNPIDKIAVSSRLISFPTVEAFMVKAKGKSMEPRIFEGDLVIARKTQNIVSGNVYVCINNTEALIKRVELDGKNIILRPENSQFKPFVAADDFRIEGEVKGIISRRI